MSHMDDQTIAAVSGALSHALSVNGGQRNSRELAEALLRTLEQTGFYVIQVPDSVPTDLSD